MKTKILGVVIGALSLFAFACTNQNTAATNSSRQPAVAASPGTAVDELATAGQHYQKHCSECHGEMGNGGTVKKDGRPLKVPSLREGHAVSHSDQDLVKQVLNGGEGMPAFKDKVSPAEAADIIKYVRREFQQK